MTNTKDNNQLATKKDLQSLFQRIETRFETKGELKKTEKNLRTEILKVEEKVETIQEQQQQMRLEMTRMSNKMTEGFTMLQNTLDGFVGRVDDLATDNQVGTHQTRELRIAVNDHKKN